MRVVCAKATQSPNWILRSSLIPAVIQNALPDTTWPFQALFPHLSNCETVMKINTVPDVRGQAEITYSGSCEKQTLGLNEEIPTPVCFLKTGSGRMAQWISWSWGSRVRSKALFISLVARLGLYGLESAASDSVSALAWTPLKSHVDS